VSNAGTMCAMCACSVHFGRVGGFSRQNPDRSANWEGLVWHGVRGRCVQHRQERGRDAGCYQSMYSHLPFQHWDLSNRLPRCRLVLHAETRLDRYLHVLHCFHSAYFPARSIFNFLVNFNFFLNCNVLALKVSLNFCQSVNLYCR